MTTIRRRFRQRLDAPESLAATWDRGDPPPAWARVPEHHDDLLALYFGLDGPAHRRALDHPHREAWHRAVEASK